MVTILSSGTGKNKIITESFLEYWFDWVTLGLETDPSGQHFTCVSYKFFFLENSTAKAENRVNPNFDNQMSPLIAREPNDESSPMCLR